MLTVSLDDPFGLRLLLENTPLVLHVAGPYARTGPPMLAAALAHRVHYVDVNGEPAFLRTRLAADEAARQANVVLVGGAGFGVTAAEGLALHLLGRLPTATRWRIGVAPASASTSEAAAQSRWVVLREGGQRIVDGRVLPRPLADVRWHENDDRGLRVSFAAAPLAELLALARLGGVEEATVGVPMPPFAARLLRALGPILLPVLRRLPTRSRSSARGDGERALTGRTYLSRVWAEADDRQGRRATARFETGEAYAFAARAAIRAVEAVLAGTRPGAWTPGAAFGSAFLPGITGVRLVDGETTPTTQHHPVTKLP